MTKQEYLSLKLGSAWFLTFLLMGFSYFGHFTPSIFEYRQFKEETRAAARIYDFMDAATLSILRSHLESAGSKDAQEFLQVLEDVVKEHKQGKQL